MKASVLTEPHPYQDYFNEKQDLIREKKCHYFVIGGGIWYRHENLAVALKKHKTHSGGIGIARVWFLPIELPTTEDAEYLILFDLGRPEVYGHELIAEIDYGKRR
tara:strand:- start:1788 stop:2102 length:315 start_codon:yes stop_codon:yes gene_type:complete